MVIDTPLWRDIPIILMGVIIFFTFLLRKQKFSINFLDILFIVYFIFGIVGISTSDMLFIDKADIFRSYYFVIILYFIARYIFKNDLNYFRLTKIIFLLVVILSIDIIIENLFVNILGYQKDIFPWVAYKAELTNVLGNISGGQSNDIIKIGTVSGFPHSTMLLFGGLFLYLFPFLISNSYLNKQKYLFRNIQKRKPKIGLMIIFSLCIFLGSVKLVILMFLSILIIYLFAINFRAMIKYLISITLAFLILFIIFPTVSNTIVKYYNNIIIYLETWGMVPIYYLQSVDIYNLFFHSFIPLRETYFLPFVSEVRIIQYTAAFGLIWLLFYILINFYSIKKCLQGISSSNSDLKLFYIGSLGFIIIYIADMFHYAVAFQIVNIDYWLIMLAAISSASNRRDMRIT